MGVHPLVRCDCGWEGFIHKRYLNNTVWTGAGCPECRRSRADERVAAMPDKAQRVRMLSRYHGIKVRCTNPNSPAWASYGGRGIKLCREWLESPAAFLRYVQTLPGWDRPELDLDRTDNDRGYEPGNVRFLARDANCRNKRRVNTLQQRIADLEAENARLRSRLGGTEDAVHGPY